MCLLIEKYQHDRPIAIQRLVPVLPALIPDLGVARRDAEKKISRDPEVVRCYPDDPLVYRALAVMQRLPAALPRLSVPLGVLHGTDDQICPLAGSVMVHDAVSSADKTPRRYPGLYHEVFNELEREQILTDLTFWLAAHLPSNGSASHSAG